MELISDNHLMTHVKKGDLQKMNLLFHRYHKRLYGFFWHNNLDQTICEDLVQTVFYRMIKYRESFDESLTFRTWMFALAKNALADEVKKTKNREHAHQESSRELALADFDKGLQKSERNDLLKLALNKLTDDARQILLWARFEELSYREIAALLNISEANVKVRVHRAMKELKEIYLKLDN